MIVVLGTSGYIGGVFADELTRQNIEFRGLSRSCFDYTNLDILSQYLRHVRADFVINSAGYTGKPNVDACETHKSECLSGNAILPTTVAKACRAVGIPWGHVSSGCIFTGNTTDGSGFRETEEPNFCFRTNNCSWYSGCKALGEECLGEFPETYIWRPRIPFSHVDSPRNYLSKLMRYDRLLDAENSISNLNEFVRACIQCWTLQVPFGTYNVTNTGSITTRRVTELMNEYLCPERSFKFFDSESDFMANAAKTPRSNCVLDNSKLLRAGIKMPHVENSIIKSLQHWQNESNSASNKLAG